MTPRDTSRDESEERRTGKVSQRLNTGSARRFTLLGKQIGQSVKVLKRHNQLVTGALIRDHREKKLKVKQ